MKKILSLALLILVTTNLIAAEPENPTAPIDNGLDTISLGDLLSSFAARNDLEILVDPGVDARIQLLGISNKEVDFPHLHTILNLHQLGIAKIDGMYVVTAMNTLRQRSLLLSAEQVAAAAPSETIVTVVDVKNVPAAQMVPILRPLIPQSGSLSAFLPSNKLILQTSKHNTEALLSIIKSLDVKTDLNFK